MNENLAIITGTTSGIGKALAEHLSSGGWMVVGVARRPVELDSPDYQHIRCDLADLNALTDSLFPELEQILTERSWRRIALINNAASPDN